MKLEDFVKKYKYKTDEEQFGYTDVWETPKVSVDGYIYSDCESFLFFLKNKVEGFEGLEIWYCKFDGNGHAVGKLGNKWIDCMTKELVVKLGSRYSEFKKFSNFEIWARIISTKIFGRVISF